MTDDLHHYKCGIERKIQKTDIDPITTQIIRNSLNSAAEQMKKALCRTAMSPIIYEVLDFAGAIYDRDLRMLAQAPSLPLFMGTLNFCIEEAVKGMLPKNKLGNQMFKKLKVYKGDNHPHESQEPQIWEPKL